MACEFSHFFKWPQKREWEGPMGSPGETLLRAALDSNELPARGSTAFRAPPGLRPGLPEPRTLLEALTNPHQDFCHSCGAFA